MNTRKLFLSLVAALFGFAISATAQTQTTQATVARVTGPATVTLPDGSSSALKAGMKVPQGATITTGANGDVFLESHAGYVTAIKPDSTVLVEELSVTTQNGTVKEEKTLLDLKSGNLVALLDAKKRNVNNYQVRTPKGVAAARGTKFAVKVYGQNATIAVVDGQVQITFQGRLAFTMAQGQVNDSATGTVSLAQYAETGPAFAALLSEIVASVAVAAERGIGGATSADVRQVADAIISAVPSMAPAIARAVQTYAPSQSQVIRDSTEANAPNQSSSVNRAVENPQTTTPQVIDPSTVSRSN